MSVSSRIRGQETTLKVVIDGQTMEDSFSAVEQFKWNPRQDLSDSPFLGETEDEPDIQHHGYDFSFTTHEKENSPVEQLLLRVVSTLAAGIAQPDITLIFIKKYRDPSAGTKTLVFRTCKIKLDGQDAGARKDYVKNTFSGKCRVMEVI